MNAYRNTLVCYEDVRDIFVSRKESLVPMQTYLDMGNQFIYNVKTPVNNDQGANKAYADTKLSLSSGVIKGNLDINKKRDILKLAQPNGDDQPTTKIYTDNNFLKLNGDGAMAGPLNMSNNKITHLAQTTANGDAVHFNFSINIRQQVVGIKMITLILMGAYYTI